MNTDLQYLVKQLQASPGYMSCGKRRIAERFDVDEDIVAEAKRIIRGVEKPVTNSTPEPIKHELDAYLAQHGIKKSDVSQVYYKESSGGTLFTVQTTHSKNQQQLNKEELYNYLSEQTFDLPEPLKTEKSNTVSIINIFDAHIDKLSYVGEGGMKELNDNLNKLKENFNSILQDVLQDKPETIVFPIGSDFFNSNGSAPHSTKKGTPQQVTVHWQHSFEAGVNFYRSCIDEIIKHCNIHILDLSGNHDADKVYYLGQVIKAIYENDDRVTLQLNRDNRKYVFLNDVLIGYQHGDIAKRKIQKLPNVMAIEQKDNWAKAEHRVWILGDVHHSEKYTTFSSFEDMGVDINFYRPATSNDVWHYENMWIGAKKSLSATSYVNGATKIKQYEVFF